MNKKIGIWGLGVGGTALLTFFAKQGYQLQVMDKRIPTPAERAFLDSLSIDWISQDLAIRFFEYNDLIIPSPGIDISPVAQYHDKFATELDTFYHAWGKQTIAITGSIGKTSLMTLLHDILTRYAVATAVGGNIGIGMMDIVSDEAPTALLELSSFQLEHAAHFAPDIAILTNLFANHLDRHKTIDAYFLAKYRLFMHQKPNQIAIIPLELQKLFLKYPQTNNRPLHFFTTAPDIEFESIRTQDTLYYIDATNIIKFHNGDHKALIKRSELPPISYESNWLIIASILDSMQLDTSKVTTFHDLSIPQHRCQLVRTHAGVSYYNDSKSTVTQATLAAVDKLQNQPIHLLLGGLSKGVDREPLIAALQGEIASIICFGKEAEQLHTFCQNYSIDSHPFATLEEAFAYAHKIAQENEVVLLSPAGSSFDLFKDYQERGERFIKLVHELGI